MSASTFCTSRQRSRRLFFNQKIAAVTFGDLPVPTDCELVETVLNPVIERIFPGF